MPILTGETEMQIIDVINILGNDFSNIYCVNCKDQSIQIYRYENTNVGVKEVMNQKKPYKAAIKGYVEANVISEDREKMLIATEFENVCNQLKQSSQFTVHYRVKRNNEILYYRMKCARIGDADSFQNIVFAFASEDSDVRLNELGLMMKSSGATGKRKILIVEDDELNQEMLFSLLEDKYEIITAKNGKVGLELLEEHYKELSLILLDIHMPVMDGFEFLKKIQKEVLFTAIPIIVMTANNEIETELTCLDLGAADYIKKPYNAELIRKKIRNVIKLKESSLTLKVVEQDELTRLYTEQAFSHYVKQIMRFRPNKEMHLIIGKIKDFKLINSIYGTKKGDELLCYLASEYSKRLKEGLVARKGSSTFICLSYGESKLNHQKLNDVVNEIIEKAPIAGVKVKYGIYENIDKNLPINTICDYASMAAETIIENYDCDCAYYTEEVAQKRIYNQMIENNFISALKNRKFVVYYQPKVDIITEKVIGAEALVRWKRTDGSMVSPGDFIPVYENDGQIQKLDEYIFEEVCKLQRRIIEESKALLSISVNLSRSSILYEGIVDQYREVVKENEIPVACVPLEITESAAIYGQKFIKVADQLLKAGFELHIDDFGSCYSSLASLSELSFNTLKIDKSLIDHICEEKGQTLVRQVIMLSKMLNMKVLAEGVETKEQLDLLRKMKCDEIQGFYYARPMPEKEFVEYVRKKR